MSTNSSQTFGYSECNSTIYEHRTNQSLIAGARRNLQELSKLIERLFERNSRILVVRLDLKYYREVAQNVPIEVTQMHREMLLGDRREHPEVFDGMLGYAWGLECGDQESGYHYHFLFFYDGAKRHEDISIGFAIDALWKTITNGFGYCHISNLAKEKFASRGTLGIGMIHRNDVALRINLIERVAAYITKKSSAFDIRSGRTESGDFRTFGKSWMPKPLNPTLPRRGRPPVNGCGWSYINR